MNTNRVTVRYAKALADAAGDVNLIDKIQDDINLLFSSITEYPHFASFIEAPSMFSSTKLEKIQSVYGNQLNDLTYRFLKMVFEKNRDIYLKDICRNFLTMMEERNNEASATLELAYPIQDETILKLKKTFEQKTGKNINLVVTENAELIGGFLFTIDDTQYDASIQGKLEKMKKQLNLK